MFQLLELMHIYCANVIYKMNFKKLFKLFANSVTNFRNESSETKFFAEVKFNFFEAIPLGKSCISKKSRKCMKSNVRIVKESMRNPKFNSGSCNKKHFVHMKEQPQH